MKERTHPYGDILHLPRPDRHFRPPMSRQDRAAQFAPFAALTGHHAAIAETGRVTERKIELTEDEREQLDRRQQRLQQCAHRRPPISVTYFRPDPHKEGGAYCQCVGQLRGVNLLTRHLRLVDGTDIPLDDIVALDSPMFGDGEM